MNQELYHSASVNKVATMKNMKNVCALVKGAVLINYCLKSEVGPLRFILSYVQLVTLQYKSRAILKPYL